MDGKLFLSIAARIILFFALMMGLSFLPPYLRDFFGDTLRTEPCWSGPDKMYDWGTRHYMFVALCIVLMILSLIDTIIFIVHQINKKYPDL